MLFLKSVRRKAQLEKAALEKEIATLKLQKESVPSKKMDELRKQNTDLLAQIDSELKKTTEVTSKYEQLEEQHVFIKAQLTSDKQALETSNSTLKSKMTTLETNLERFKRDNIDLSRKILDVQTKCKELESKSSQNMVIEHERKRLLSSLQEKSHQYELLVSENEMNKDLNEQLKKEVKICCLYSFILLYFCFWTWKRYLLSSCMLTFLSTWHSFHSIVSMNLKWLLQHCLCWIGHLQFIALFFRIKSRYIYILAKNECRTTFNDSDDDMHAHTIFNCSNFSTERKAFLSFSLLYGLLIFFRLFPSFMCFFFSLFFFQYAKHSFCFSLSLSFQNDELRKKLGDFNKVNKVQASLNDHNSNLEQEIKQLKAK